ncbi:uncharacterized protein [Gossypium hirsutum]|uniref:Retrotransposon gag domain-containing protein n=1 Tax=Gossypium hirsutum TaxID=3635 RepID=A0A1U8I2L2_GOSHI|nr:uncharacterized protein LOC107889870 [Gossypium hirsutum]
MTRRNPGTLVQYNPKIEASARRNHGQTLRRKKQQEQRERQSNLESTSTTPPREPEQTPNERPSPNTTNPITNPTFKPEQMANQTIRELAAAPAVQPLCITFPQGTTPFQLKTGLIHLFPTFNGLPSESPHKHLAEFHMVCNSMKPQGVSEDQIKLRAFPFSLAGMAKEWLFYLPPNSITIWAELSRVFLDRYFPAAKASELRRSILRIQQRSDESLYDYWERFKKLCASCPQHGLSEQTLLQYLYEGMLLMEKKMVDAASGGVLVNMTPENARTLISTMAANSQQFGSSSKIGAAKVCGICTMPNHPTDSCPMLQDETGAQVNAINNFPRPPQRPYNPYEKFQTQTQSHLQEIDKQISQLAQTVGRLESQGRLPSQTETNPRENVSAITLRSGTVISPEPTKEPEKIEKDKKDTSLKSQEEKSSPTSGNVIPSHSFSTYETPPPFPEKLARRDKKEEEKEILDIFKKVEINIPLLDVILKVPKYTKFLKDLCTNQRQLSGNERVNLNENISAIFQRRLPQKYKDQGMFAIPCKIGKVGIKRAICDLGASINVIPLSVYNKISTEPLKEMRVTVQLADRSVIYPEGVLENVLVKVNDLIFPADFYIIDMENDRSNNGSEILLGRPFLSTAHTKIDVCNGILTMEFDGKVVKFDVYKAMKYPDSIVSLNFIEIIDPLADDFIETDLFYDFCRDVEDLNDENEIISTLSSISNSRLIPSKPLPSILQAPQLELKQFPSHLKYEFLGDNRTLPIIISSELSRQEEEELIAVLRTYKKAIGWTLADIQGLSPPTCMHKIKTEENAKPTREGQ